MLDDEMTVITYKIEGTGVPDIDLSKLFIDSLLQSDDSVNIRT